MLAAGTSDTSERATVARQHRYGDPVLRSMCRPAGAAAGGRLVTPPDRTRLRRTIAVINGKGGVGKTSIVANIGGLLAAAEYRVLLVDLDPQGNLGEDLGYAGAGLGDDGRGLFLSVSTGTPLQPLRNVRPGLDVIPGGEELNDLAATLYARRQRNAANAAAALATTLATVAGDYDLVLLDCPPGQDVLQEAALVAARWVLIPTRTDASSRKGLREVGRRFLNARTTNPHLELLGVVLFGVTSAAKRITAQARADLNTDLGGVAPLFQTAIRYVEAAAVDARNRGQLVHELERDVLKGPKWYELLRSGTSKGTALAASAGTLAADYQALAEEVLTRLVDAESHNEVTA